MLVEDNELNSEIATEILSEYGFIVDTAEKELKGARVCKHCQALDDGADGRADAHEWVARPKCTPKAEAILH